MEHNFNIGDVVYDTDDKLFFVVEGIGDGPFILAEKGLYGTVVGTGEFHWNYLHLTVAKEDAK